MIHLSYNGELYSYDNKTTTTVSSVTNIPITIHPYEDIEGAKLYYKQNDTEGIVDITNNVANIPGEYLVTGDLQVALRLASGVMSNTFTLGVTVISSSGDVKDDDIQFTMDNKKRLILVPGYQTLLAIQFDNQSEIVTFKFPRYQEGVDLSTKTPYVNYRRPQVKDLGKALCTIDKVEEDIIYFSWLVDETATQFEGVIQFQVEFAGENNYRWQSQIGELPILTSLYNTGLEPYSPSFLEEALRQMQQYSSDAEAFAVGTRNGVPVVEGDPAYENNAAYYARDMSIQGLTNEMKQTLLACFEHVGWELSTDGQQYYDALRIALYPPVNLLSISAVFEQGETIVWDTDDLDVLRPMLTVTAHYSDSSAATITDYILSGTLTEGECVVSVLYGGKTATINVTVTEKPTLGSLMAGTEVTIMESNVAKPWIYLGQDSSDNCILIRKNTYTTRAMNSSALTTTDYDGTSMDEWLQGDYQTRFTQALASYLSPKSITYTVYAPSDSPTSFTKTISRSVYLPSMYEMGFGGSEGGDSYLDVLKAFYNTTDTKTARIANNESGTAVHYWSRTATTQADNRFRYVRQWGDEIYGTSTLSTVCTRPMMSLLPTTPISEVEGGGYVVG